MSAVAQLSVRANVEALWDRYTALVRAMQDDHALFTDIDHQQALVRAWASWRDAFLAAEG